MKLNLSVQHFYCWLEIPSIINQFLNRSKLINLLTFYNIKPINSYINFSNSLTPRRNDTLFNLEFLETIGDTILKFITCSILYEEFNQLEECQLSKLKAVFISNQYYSLLANIMGLGYFLADNDDTKYNQLLEDDKLVVVKPQ